MTSGWGDLVSLLDRRFDVLDALVDAPMEKRDLVDELDVSRSTVDRAVRELEAHELVERTDAGVRVALLGRLALAAHVGYRREIATLDRYGDVLAHLDSTAPLPPWVLVGADLYRPEPPRMIRPHERARAELEDADRIRGLTKALSDPVELDRLHEAVLSGDVEVDLVVTTGVIDHLRASRGDDLIRALREDSLTLHERDELPFGLLVADPEAPHSTALLFVYDDGQLVGMLKNRRPSVVDWAMALFRGLRTDADPVDATIA